MTLAVVNPTPGTVQIEKSKDTITVRCKKEGFFETAETLDSEVQGMTFGNILFGGIIGVAVDASSGAMNQYPSSVTIALVPESFRSEEHTSELQSLMRISYAVFCLKTKNKIQQ